MTRDPTVLKVDFAALGFSPEEADRFAARDAEGPPQLERHAVLAAAWLHVVDNEGRWLEEHKDAWPMNRAIRALVEAGASAPHLTALVRTMQFELLAGITALLDAGRDGRTSARWGLFEVDDAGRPQRRIVALHESVTSSDPTGEADGWM